MQFLRKDGVALAFEDTGADLPSLLFVHGCSLDHHSFDPQVEYFRPTHRVVSVDLRGHGASDAPRQEYTMAGYAEDLAWLCGELGLVKPVIVGHSMGGNAGLELAARYPDALRSLVMIDSCLLTPPLPLHFGLEAALHTPDYLAVWQQGLTALSLPSDKEAPQVIASLRIQQHVLASAWQNHVTRYDAASAAEGCRVPVAYVGSTMPFVDLARFQALTPQLVIGHTLGSGHFSTLEVPDQINAMLATFIKNRESVPGDRWKSSVLPG